MKVRLSIRAARDFDEAVNYYLERSPKASASFADEMERLFERPATHPNSARKTSNPAIRRAVVRHFPFLVFYRTRGATVHVLHIRHGLREPWRVARG
jgi:plasmid stabilization system protein ParE